MNWYKSQATVILYYAKKYYIIIMKSRNVTINIIIRALTKGEI